MSEKLADVLIDLSDSKIEQDIDAFDYENCLRVNVDDKNNFYFNLNQQLWFEMDQSSLLSATTNADAYWTTISWNLYKTTRLAWLLLQVNNVKPDNVLDIVKSGSVIKYVPNQYLDQLVEELRA